MISCSSQLMASPGLSTFALAPDSSLLLPSLDGMGKHLLAQHAQVAFRLSLSRHSLRLDYQASVETVEEYAKVMLAEFEVLSLASEAKKQRVRKVKEKEEEPSSPPPPEGIVGSREGQGSSCRSLSG